MKIFFGIAMAMLLSAPNIVFAEGLNTLLREAQVQNAIPKEVVTVKAQTAEGKIFSVFQIFVNVVLYSFGVGAVAMIVFAGTRLVYSAGDEQNIEGAKKMLLYAVIGLLITFFAFILVQNLVGIITKR